MNALLNGNVYSHSLSSLSEGWEVSWESKAKYRHWCHQKMTRYPEADSLLVVMFNPGSLSGDGKNLSRDTTLRILREVCEPAKLNPFIINLFDYASPSPSNLFDHWENRDGGDSELVYDHVKHITFIGVIYAYGNYENCGRKDDEIKMRAAHVRNKFASLIEIELPLNKSGTPKHPMVWQRQKLKPEIKKSLCQVSKPTRGIDAT